jgi:predicted MPP superfamily phosphohydrolase
MSKIQYCSDLHLEFSENTMFLKDHAIEAAGDILILAGDIIPFAVMDKFDWFFDDVSKRFKQVYWIPGNHEYYYSDINQRTGSFCEEIRSNVFLLNNRVIETEDARLVFSTLWSKLTEANQWNITQRLSDFQVIKKGEERFTSTDYNSLHLENLSFLQDALRNKKQGKDTVVITHHVPTFLNYPEKHKGDALNEAFAVELFDFIEENTPDYWIFGHHHSNIPSFRIGNTQLLTNQLGYVKYSEHSQFSFSAVIQ